MANKKKKRKTYYNSITYLTGCPGLNMKRFNQELGLCEKDKDKETNKDVANEINNELADAATTAATNDAIDTDTTSSDIISGDSTGADTAGAGGAADNGATVAGDAGDASSTGGLGESLLTEADEPEKAENENEEETEKEMPKKAFTSTANKREVKRYYLRPQNIFCANKKEIVQALVELGNTNNCSIYTLNNLPDDDKDVHKLTNRDIIYYYDDGILYDKNHVKVMDYDLFIRKEEQRKRFPGGVDSVSDQEFNRVYQDRVTESLVDNPFNLNFDSYNAYGEKLVEGKVADNICCICGEPYEGYGNNAEPYADGYCCDSCNIHFVIPARLSALHQDDEENISEGVVKQGKKWANKGDSGEVHGTFRTKKEADAQRKAMFANGFKESLNEEEEIPAEFNDQMDYLSADEEEAINAYAAVINKVDDEHVKDQLTKIETEEKAHKDYLEKVKDDKTIDYVEPLEDEDSKLTMEEE